MRLFIFALTSALLVLSTAATPTPPLTSSLSLINRALSNVTSTDPSITIIHTTKAAIPSSPISQAIVSGDHIYVSGYLPLAPVTGVIVGPGDVVQQTIAVLQNIKIVIEEAGSHLGKVVRVGLYLKNIEDYAVVNKAYAEFFGTHRPARTAFAVANIPLGVLVQIDAIVRL